VSIEYGVSSIVRAKEPAGGTRRLATALNVNGRDAVAALPCQTIQRLKGRPEAGMNAVALCAQLIIRSPYAAPIERCLFWSTEPLGLRASARPPCPHVAMPTCPLVASQRASLVNVSTGQLALWSTGQLTRPLLHSSSPDQPAPSMASPSHVGARFIVHSAAGGRGKAAPLPSAALRRPCFAACQRAPRRLRLRLTSAPRAFGD